MKTAAPQGANKQNSITKKRTPVRQLDNTALPESKKAKAGRKQPVSTLSSLVISYQEMQS
ncbi:hypothetical protein HNQ50_002785 [Silvimonas terrae]|uniref:Uncharacterized protein n=1 Tax=Silvimonas terrae TaxID=300266 RepID=A0A840RHP8_9NEIS|nr:hypothetical protein [Silvimonas terrae]MBB5192048.1 hypothetical protein [Silvimonas terrae]